VTTASAVAQQAAQAAGAKVWVLWRSICHFFEIAEESMDVHWEDSFGDFADGRLNAPPGLALFFALFFFGVVPTALLLVACKLCVLPCLRFSCSKRRRGRVRVALKEETSSMLQQANAARRQRKGPAHAQPGASDDPSHLEGGPMLASVLTDLQTQSIVSSSPADNDIEREIEAEKLKELKDEAERLGIPADPANRSATPDGWTRAETAGGAVIYINDETGVAQVVPPGDEFVTSSPTNKTSKNPFG